MGWSSELFCFHRIIKNCFNAHCQFEGPKPSMRTAHSANATNKKQKQRSAFRIYDEEDILNLDAVIVTPPPRQSSTIRVKLIYEEPGKPIPVENPWEE